MIKPNRYLLLLKEIVVFTIFFHITSFCLCAQCLSSQDFYKQIISIETSQEKADLKLKKILLLKNKYEACKLPADSVYARLLHRTGALDYQANNQMATQNAINYTLEAAHINVSGRRNTSIKSAVNSYYNLGNIYYSIDSYDKALLYFDSLLYYNRNYSDSKDKITEALKFEVYIYWNRRDYQKCIELCTLGIQNTKAINDTTNLIAFYFNRTKSYTDLSLWKQAFRDIDSGFYYITKSGIQQLTADFTIQKALYFAAQKDFENANACFNKAVQIRIKEKDTINLRLDYLNLAKYFNENKHDYAIAKEWYLKLIPLYKGSQDKDGIARNYTDLGESEYRLGHLKKARKYDSIAYLLLTQLPSYNFFQNASAEQLSLINDEELILILLNNKVDLLLNLYKENKQSDCLQSCLETALLLDTLITQNNRKQLGEQSKLYGRNSARDFFSNVIEACYLARNIPKAFYFMEKSRAVLLQDKISELNASVYLSPADEVKQFNLRNVLVEKQQQLALASPATKEYSEAENSLVQTSIELENYIRYLEKRYPVYYQYKYADYALDLSSFEEFLKKYNQSFIYYYKNDSIIYALSISKNKTTFIKISAHDFDIHKLSDFINLCSNKQAANNNYGTFASLSQSIYNSLFKPLNLPKGNVAICTDNFFIPFEALCTDDKGKNFLLYDYNFSYVYSARSLMKPFTGNKAADNFAGFAPVYFSSQLGVLPLRNSATALTNVAGYYTNSTLFIKQQATRNNFFNKASKYAVVTIFSHAQADTTDKEPVLYMQDSLIHLSELGLLRNPAIQFVLLSACQTNIGRNATGEGIYSLARGFAAAGVPSVSATLWKADEETVYRISAKFNEYLAQGMNKSEALQKAKVWYLQNSNREHTLPYYWANMVLIGTSQPISLTASNPWWYWVAIVIGFVLIVSAGYYFFIKKMQLKI